MSKLQELRAKPHWSYSGLDQLLNRCALQWAFGHVYKQPRERLGAELPFGSAFHAAASELARQKAEGATPRPAEIQDAFSDWWSLEVAAEPDLKFKEGATPDNMNNSGRDMVGLLCASWPSEEQVLDVAPVFSVEIYDAGGNPASDKPLIGEMDLVVLDGKGKITIVDWKTSARRWPQDKAEDSLQPTCLCYGHALEVGSVPSFRFDVFVKNKTPVVERHCTERNAEDFNRLAELVKVAERITKVEAYSPRRDWQCSDCAYSGACKDWHRQQAKTISIAA